MGGKKEVSEEEGRWNDIKRQGRRVEEVEIRSGSRVVGVEKGQQNEATFYQVDRGGKIITK